MSNKLRYAVDIPSCLDFDNAWMNAGYFETKAEAVAFVKETFGGDSKGRIGLVSELPPDDEND